MKNAIDSLEKLKHSIEINISGVGSCDYVPFTLAHFWGDLSFIFSPSSTSSETGNVLKILDLLDGVPTDLSSFIRSLCSEGLYDTYLKNVETFNYIFHDKQNLKKKEN